MFVSINNLVVPEAQAAEVGRRFDQVKGHLIDAPGFSCLRLLRPHTEGKRWLVYTEWESATDYDKWKSSALFQRMHPDLQHPGHAGGGHPGAHGGFAIEAEVVTYDVAVRLER
ncbi:antibiotic biosynthesis monooxygenase family protein [Actinocorallia populi]|uniref:antibiotic biosynthesis monooxygenase family protein n=1 Tax=Actinocorallia populi TaxID=2079200 RepID=UPI00130055AE|nr:antibiotic biosynthesis monooxygenase [Actinocorallia populi]